MKKTIVLVLALFILSPMVSCKKLMEKIAEDRKELTASLTINQIHYTGTTFFSGVSYDYRFVSRVYKDEASDSLHMYFHINSYHYDTLGTTITRNVFSFDHYLRIHQKDWNQCEEKDISLQRDPLKNEYFLGVAMGGYIERYDERNLYEIWSVRSIKCDVTNAILIPVGKTNSDVGKQQFRIKIWAKDCEDDSPYEVEGECRVRFIPTKDKNYEGFIRYHKDAE